MIGVIEMGYDHEPGYGSVFANQDKQAGDNRPGLKGKVKLPAECGGVTCYIAMWKKRKKDGEIYYSVKIQLPEEQRNQPKEQGNQYKDPDEWGDDVPF